MQTLLPFGIWHFTVYNISSAHRRIAASIVVLVYPFTFAAFPFVLHMYRLGQCPRRIYLRAEEFFFFQFLKSRGFCLLIFCLMLLFPRRNCPMLMLFLPVLSLSFPRPTSARRPVMTGRDRCAAGPAAPCRVDQSRSFSRLRPSPRAHARTSTSTTAI